VNIIVVLVIFYSPTADYFLGTETTPTTFNCKWNHTHLKDGKEHFKNSKVVIAGLLRQREDIIDFLKPRLSLLTKQFGEYKVLFVENDSTDNTRKELLKMAQLNNNVLVLGCEVNASQCKLNIPITDRDQLTDKDYMTRRIAKMVTLRNVYLKFVHEHLSDYDYLIVWDFDIYGSFYLDGIWSSGYFFHSEPSVDAMCANGRWRVVGSVFKYYDDYAHEDSADETSALPVLWRSYSEGCGSKLYKVNSCFNGLSMYRISSLKNLEYSLGFHPNGEVICEHIPIHRKLPNMYLNPSLVYSVREH